MNYSYLSISAFLSEVESRTNLILRSLAASWQPR